METKKSTSLIMGTIQGIDRADYHRLREALESHFDRVVWKNGSLVIRSERDHSGVRSIFENICQSMADGKFGSLLYVGRSLVACIYFARGRFVGKLYREPRPPDWWGISKEDVQ